MNRLTPLIVRRTGAHAAIDDFAPSLTDPIASHGRLDDLKLFALGWLGGLIFFGTYLS